MTLLSDAVAIVNSVTLALNMQASGAQRVTLKKYAGDGGTGAPTYNPAGGTPYDSVVEKKQRQMRTFSGQLATSSATVTFLLPSIVVGPGDVIILADGTGGEVMGAGGPVDASGQLITEAYL